MKERIVAFDLEMLNSDPSSICSIGIVEYIDRRVNSTFYSLIKPKNLSFDYYAYNVHGIRSKSLYKEKSLKQIWPTIKHYFDESIIISHDIHSDMTHLRSALYKANIPFPDCIMSCTNVIAHIHYKNIEKYNLEYLMSLYDYKFKPHNALEDAKATGKLLFRMLDEENTPTLFDFHKKYQIPFGEMRPNYYKNLLSAEAAIKVEEGFNVRYFSHHNISLIGEINMSKEEFETMAKKTHAFYTKHISIHTNYVVLGKLNKNDCRKFSKVKELINKGQDIKIISEQEFLEKFDQINEYTQF